MCRGHPLYLFAGFITAVRGKSRRNLHIGIALHSSGVPLPKTPTVPVALTDAAVVLAEGALYTSAFICIPSRLSAALWWQRSMSNIQLDMGAM